MLGLGGVPLPCIPIRRSRAGRSPSEEVVQETGLAEKPQEPNTYRNAYEIRQDCAAHEPVMGCHALAPVGMNRSGNARAVSVRTCPLPSVHDAPQSLDGFRVLDHRAASPRR